MHLRKCHLSGAGLYEESNQKTENSSIAMNIPD
jgi:hypothetical protein